MASEAPATTWPERCCVPALVWDAARYFGVHLNPRRLAVELGVRVAVGDENPWCLAFAGEGDTIGVDLHDVLTRWDSLEPYRAHGLELRHVPIRSLDMPLAAWLSGHDHCYVGVGVDYPHYFGVTTSPEVRHVLRLVSVSGRSVEVYDPSRPQLGPATWDLRRLEDSVEVVDDGFWLFNKSMPSQPGGV